MQYTIYADEYAGKFSLQGVEKSSTDDKNDAHKSAGSESNGLL
jgi:hypothetical protein